MSARIIRFVSVIAVLALLVPLIAACVVPVTPAPAKVEKFDLRVATINDPTVNKVMDILVAGFGAKHPNINVKLEFQVGDYAEKMFTMAAAGTLPDVVWTADIFTLPFVKNGVLLDMQPLAEKDPEFDINDVYPSILGLGRIEGDPGLYMIPASLDVVTMYYNKSAFEKAGAQLPTNDWTWDDLVAACQLITKEKDADGKPVMWCLHNNTWNWWATVVPWIRGYGGDVLSADGTKSTLSTPESLAGLQAYVDLWTKYDIAVPLGSEFGGDCFLLEKCAVYFHIPGQRAWLRENVGDKFEWDVALMPAHPKGRFTGMGTYGFAISAQTKHPEAAWDFVKYLASATGQRIIARGYAGIPLLKSMADDPAWRELPPPPTNNEAFIKGADIGILPRTYPLECGSLYTGQVNQVISGALERSIRGQTTVEEAFQGADAEIQACLDKVYKK